MNLRRVLRILGVVLYVLSVAQLVPLVWCLSPLAWDAATGLLVGAGISAALGLVLRSLGDDSGELYRREGVVVVVGSWLLASIIGAVPYLASGAISSPVDALFESASGFTTTGASILHDIEAVPAAILFWRSMTQWLGGIGIVVLFVALLSELGPGARFLFKLEVPGPKAERIVRLRGSIRLDYFADYRVVKLANAIPEEWVQGLTRDGRRAPGAAHKQVESPKLRADHSRAGRENTRFWLRLQPTDARVVAIEVFDAHGMAWPRIPWHGSLPSDVDMLHFAVPGPAEPPFSLALLVSTGQVEARVPVELKDLPLVPKAEPGADE